LDALTDEHFLARDMIDLVPDLVFGTLPAPGVPLRYSESPVASGLPAPTLGEHNHDVLGHLLGLSDSEVDALHGRGVLVRGDR
jgi:crotonobetainyl-CoA:carnitine CoA-transferase CaiB-like acyl-CoA transferase